jgi:hypothetical protein
MRGKDWFPSNRKVGSHGLGLALGFRNLESEGSQFVCGG